MQPLTGAYVRPQSGDCPARSLRPAKPTAGAFRKRNESELSEACNLGCAACSAAGPVHLVSNPSQARRGNEIQYSEFLDSVDKGQVLDATLAGNRISGTMRDAGPNGPSFSTFAPKTPIWSTGCAKRA